MQSNPIPPHLRCATSTQSQEDSTQAGAMKPGPIPPHLRRSSAAMSQEVLTKATAAQSSYFPPQQQHPNKSHSQEVLTKAGWIPPHLRKKRNDQVVSGVLYPKPDFSPGSEVTNVETRVKEHTRAQEPMMQPTVPYGTSNRAPQTHDMASENLPTPHSQTGTKLAVAAPEEDSEVALAQTTSQRLPPHLRRSNTAQNVGSSGVNKQTFNEGPTSPSIHPSNLASAPLPSSDQIPAQQQAVLPSTSGAPTSSGVLKWQGSAVSLNDSPLSAPGSRAASNMLASPITVTSPGPSSAGSPIHIFPFHLRKALVSSSLVNFDVTTNQDCPQNCDNPGAHSLESKAPEAGSAPGKLPPHLRRKSSILAGNAKLVVEQKCQLPLNTTVVTPQGHGFELSNIEAKLPFIPPHLRGKKSSTKQSYDMKKSTVASTGNSSGTIGGVFLGGNGKAPTGPKDNHEVVMNPSPHAGPSSTQLNVCQGEGDGDGLIQGTNGRPAKDIAPRIYPDASIKTHSSQKYGSDVSSEWADLRKPGPVKSLCISDNDFEDDASVKKFIGAAIAEFPGEVIKLNSLNDDYFHPTNHKGQEWNLNVPDEFLNAYVKVWREKLPEEVIIVDVKATKFNEGFLIDVNSFLDALEHPESFPSEPPFSMYAAGY